MCRPLSVVKVVLCLAVGVAGLCPAPAWAQCRGDDPIGYVEQVSGEWWVVTPGSTERKVEVRTCIGSGDSLSKKGGLGSGKITIILYSGRMFRLDCATKPCIGSHSVRDPGPVRQGGVLAYLKGFWSTTGPKVPPILAAARGGADALLPTVATYADGRLRLTGAVRSLPVGTRAFRMGRLLPSIDSDIRFTMGLPEGVATVPAIPPGVYTLEVLDDAGASTSGAVAVLVLTGPDPATEALFDEAREAVRGWQDGDAVAANSYLTQAILALQARSAP